jgi:phage/plasmid-associated DNA primase
LPGILAWAVRGCVEWGGGGLGTSKAVEQATAEYRTEMDVFKQFIAEMCEVREDAVVSKARLNEARKRWAMETGEDELTMNKFARRLKEEGGVENLRDTKIGKSVRAWGGITLSDGPEFVSDPKVSPPQKSCKQRGVETSGRHFSENLQKPLGNTPHVEKFVKIDEKVSPEAKSVSDEKILQNQTKPGEYVADVISTPPSGSRTIEIENLTVHYVREES